MIEKLAKLLETRFNLPADRVLFYLRRLIIILSALSFVVISTLITTVGANADLTSLSIGDVATRSITAPDRASYISEILTEEARQQARASLLPVYDPPDPNVARQQTQVGQQILDFIENIRRDPYGTNAEKTLDLNQITALALETDRISEILQLDEETWRFVEDEIINVLQIAMREPIREDQVQQVRDRLPNLVSIRFDTRERNVIVAIVKDVIRPNTFQNSDATAAARQAAADRVADVTRTFVRGETIIDAGSQVTPADYEALLAFGLLRVEDQRIQEIGRSFLASTLILVTSGLYIMRFVPHLLYSDTRKMTLLAGIFLVMLFSTRILGVDGNIYAFPSAAMALLYVAVSGPQIAVIGALGMGLLVGIMTGNSLELATLVTSGSLCGALVLRRSERINSFFLAGLFVGIVNATVVSIFKLSSLALGMPSVEVLADISLAFFSGVLIVPATALAAMYLVSMTFNLPTALKLLDLSQPSKPLLQRLLREAPGTYQHSLQVANLSEQAANAIGADAQLTHVAGLYHDIGKMLNPIYFTENQQQFTINPHDALNDPYRSADIIIGHVIEGDEMAKQYRLPNRIRDFIREHHGTTQVFVFYQRALSQAGGDPSLVDIMDFTYPGPRPRSRETAIMMLADSCEATVRAMKPESKVEIRNIVKQIFDDKRTHGQLDHSGLTLDDLSKIEAVFVDILQGMFHPRVNYREAIARKMDEPVEVNTPEAPLLETDSRPVETRPQEESRIITTPPRTRAVKAEALQVEDNRKTLDVDEEEPLTEVPRLPSADERRKTGNHSSVKTNGKTEEDRPATSDNEAEPSEKKTDES